MHSQMPHGRSAHRLESEVLEMRWQSLVKPRETRTRGLHKGPQTGRRFNCYSSPVAPLAILLRTSPTVCLGHNDLHLGRRTFVCELEKNPNYESLLIAIARQMDCVLCPKTIG